MAISDLEIKMLWGLAAGRCSYPKCNAECIQYAEGGERGEPFIIGEMAHMIARSPGGPRGSAKRGKDEYENLILLCPSHHRLVDKAPQGEFTEETLVGWKKAHERRIRKEVGGGTPFARILRRWGGRRWNVMNVLPSEKWVVMASVAIGYLSARKAVENGVEISGRSGGLVQLHKWLAEYAFGLTVGGWFLASTAFTLALFWMYLKDPALAAREDPLKLWILGISGISLIILMYLLVAAGALVPLAILLSLLLDVAFPWLLEALGKQGESFQIPEFVLRSAGAVLGGVAGLLFWQFGEDGHQPMKVELTDVPDVTVSIEKSRDPLLRTEPNTAADAPRHGAEP